MPDTENEIQGNDVQQELMDMIIADESPAIDRSKVIRRCPFLALLLEDS